MFSLFSPSNGSQFGEQVADRPSRDKEGVKVEKVIVFSGKLDEVKEVRALFEARGMDPEVLNPSGCVSS